MHPAAWEKKVKVFAVEFIEAVVNHLCVDASVLIKEVKRLLLPVAESTYHFPVIRKPCTE